MNYVVLRGNATKSHPLLRGLTPETVQYIEFDNLPPLASGWLETKDALIIVNELVPIEQRQRGRPKYMPNGASSLDNRINEIETLLGEGIKRGELAKLLTVGRDTLNDFIAAKLPQYHRKKIV
jgi:hypothetical protein